MSTNMHFLRGSLKFGCNKEYFINFKYAVNSSDKDDRNYEYKGLYNAVNLL